MAALTVQPIKTYEVVNNGTFTTRNVELRHANMPFLWATQDTWNMGLPRVKLRTQSAKGPVVAVSKLALFTRGVDVFLGDPDEVKASGGKPAWTNVESDSAWSVAAFSFRGFGDGHLYVWKRTHNHALKSSKLSQSDYKLVDPANGEKVLAVYIKDSFMGGPNIGHIDYFVELGNDLELQTIAAILGIEERLRRNRRNY